MIQQLSRYFRLLAGGLLLAPFLLLFTGPHASAEAAVAPKTCSCPRVVDASGNPLVIPPGKQPVLLVHGFGLPGLAWPYGHYTQWSGTGGLADKLENDSNYVVGRLDYSDLHDKWVTEAGPDGKSIAELTAAAIKCMAKNTGKKVIAVGHSMGGLAIQAAVGKDPNAAENVAGVVSLGTPWKGVPRDQIDAMIKFSVQGLQLTSTVQPSWLVDQVVNHAEDYIKRIQNSSALKALEVDSSGKPSEQIQSLPLIKTGIPILPVAGIVTAVQSDELKKQTIPLTDLSTGQQVNLIGTTVTVFDNQKTTTVATDPKSNAGADPFVGADSALYPNAVGPILASQPLQCAGNGFACNTGSRLVKGDYHSALPSDPTVAEKVFPAIEEWRTKADKATIDKLAKDPGALGECLSPPSVIPTPVPTPELPKVTDPPNTSGLINPPTTPVCAPGKDLVGGHCVTKQQSGCGAAGYHCSDSQEVCRPDQQRDRDGHCYNKPQPCDHDQYWDHGQCKPQATECKHDQVTDGHGGCIGKPQGGSECRSDQARGRDGKCSNQENDCPHGQVRGAHGACSDIPNGNQGSDGNDSCPNGMVRISPETDTSSGCAPGTSKHDDPQKQKNSQKQDHPNKQEKNNSGQSGSGKSDQKTKCDPNKQECTRR